MIPELICREEYFEVWFGNSLDPTCVATIMGDRKAKLLCVDAPYSETTHAGNAGIPTAERLAGFGAQASPKRKREAAYARRRASRGETGRSPIPYEFWTVADVENFVDIWCPMVSGWRVSITDNVLAPAWGAEFKGCGLLNFAPLPLVESGSRVRMAGDGPSNWTCWVVVARPRNAEYGRFGTLPGAYIQPAERDINSSGGSNRIVGGKPLRSMMAIVRDYSRLDDLVVDPCVGGGVTGIAARTLGRRFIGIDNNRERAELSARLIAETREQVTLIRDVPDMTPLELFGGIG